MSRPNFQILLLSLRLVVTFWPSDVILRLRQARSSNMPPRLQHGHEVPGRALEAIIPGFSANGPGTQSSSSQSESDRRARSTDETPAPRRQRLITRPPNKVPDQRSQLIYDKTDQLRKRPIPRSAGAVRDPQTAAFSTDLFEPRQERLKQFREPEIDRGESSTPSAETMETSRVPSSLNRLSLPLSRGQIRTRQEAKEQEAVIHERLKRANEPIPLYEFQNFIGKGSYGRVYVA